MNRERTLFKAKPSSHAVILVACLLVLGLVLIMRLSRRTSPDGYEPIPEERKSRRRHRGDTEPPRDDNEPPRRSSRKKNEGGDKDDGRTEKTERPAPVDTKKANSEPDPAAGQPEAAYRNPGSVWNDDQPITGHQPFRAPPDHRRPNQSPTALRRRNEDGSIPPSPNTARNQRVGFNDNPLHGGQPISAVHQKDPTVVRSVDRSNLPYDFKPPKVTDPLGGKTYNYQLLHKDFKLGNLKAQLEATEPGKALFRKMQEAERLVSVNCEEERNDQDYKDAMADNWDQDIGPLPLIMSEVASRIGAYLTPETVEKTLSFLEQMQQKDVSNQRSKKRAATKFLQRYEQSTEKFPSGERLAACWFADHYRSTKGTEVVVLPRHLQQVMTELGLGGELLTWLEIMGRRFVRLRARSPSGVDLQGLIGRVAVSRRKEVAGDEHTTYWQFDLTIFLWGGPFHSKIYKDQESQWYDRMSRALEASLYSVMTSLHNAIVEEDPRTAGREAHWAYRRILFRPGHTIAGVNAARGGVRNNEAVYSQHHAIIDRPARIVQVPAFDQLHRLTQAVAEVIARPIQLLQPHDVKLLRQRQFGSEKNVKPEDNEMTPDHVAFVLHAMGALLLNGSAPTDKGMDVYSMKRHWIEIEDLDLCGYVPMTGDPEHFVSLSGFPHLKRTLLPYIDLKVRVGSTARLLLEDKHGLRERLSSITAPLEITVLIPHKKVHHFMSDIGIVLNELTQKRLLTPSGSVQPGGIAQIEDAYRFGLALRDSTMRNVKLVDDSNKNEDPQPVPYNYQAIDIKKPKVSDQVLAGDHESRQQGSNPDRRPPPASSTPTGPLGPLPARPSAKPQGPIPPQFQGPPPAPGRAVPPAA